MKRRDFLKTSALLAGGAVPILGRAAAPCPPPSIAVSGGTSAVGACGSADAAVADWQARSTGSGVLWAHRFSSPSDPSLYWAQLSTNEGGGRRFGYRPNEGVIGDGCFESFIPAGTEVNGGWTRPLAPVVGSPAVGKYLAYPADINNAGVEPLPFKDFYAYYTGDPAGKLGNACGGYVTHPEYMATKNRKYTVGGKSYNEIVYAGAEGIYLQYRTKFPTLPNGDNRLDYKDLPGKLVMFSNMSPSNANNEIVTNVMPGYGNRFFMYSDRGAMFLYDPQSASGSGASMQPGGAYSSTCRMTSSGSEPAAAACWRWPKDEWVTVLMQVVPGRHNPGYPYLPTAKYFDTAIRIWVARQGQTSYTKIWDKSDYAFSYTNGSSPTVYAGSPNPLANTEQAWGFNGVRFTAYANPGGSLAQPYPKDVLVLHDQIICSTKFIPCPAV